MTCGVTKPTCSCCFAPPRHFVGELRFCETCWQIWLYRERRDEWLRKRAA